MSVRDFLLALAGVLALATAVEAAAQPAASFGKATPESSKRPAPDSQMQPTQREDQAAVDGGKAWLTLVDRGKLGEAWDVSAKSLKSSVTRNDWVSGLADLRRPFGKLVSRTPDKFARAHSIPDAPDGDYVIIQYDSLFANGKHASEQVTLMLEDDGFRVAGYFIR